MNEILHELFEQGKSADQVIEEIEGRLKGVKIDERTQFSPEELLALYKPPKLSLEASLLMLIVEGAAHYHDLAVANTSGCLHTAMQPAVTQDLIAQTSDLERQKIRGRIFDILRNERRNPMSLFLEKLDLDLRDYKE